MHLYQSPSHTLSLSACARHSVRQGVPTLADIFCLPFNDLDLFFKRGADITLRSRALHEWTDAVYSIGAISNDFSNDCLHLPTGSYNALDRVMHRLQRFNDLSEEDPFSREDYARAFSATRELRCIAYTHTIPDSLNGVHESYKLSLSALSPLMDPILDRRGIIDPPHSLSPGVVSHRHKLKDTVAGLVALARDSSTGVHFVTANPFFLTLFGSLEQTLSPKKPTSAIVVSLRGHGRTPATRYFYC